MSANTSLAIRIAAIFDNKGLKEADKATAKLQSAVKKLAGAAGIGLSTAAVINFGKNAAKAFAENEKSAKRLETVVKNLGLAFEIPGIEASLDRVSAKFGYEGEVLREAFQKLITTTGSAKKSQDLLNLSLDIAAGSGVNLLTVNQDLAAAYTGQTRGLRKYNLGLTQSELKTLDFDSAVSKLSANFKGAGTAELETYSGKMRVLQEAADNAQEIIGGGLVESLSLLAGEGNTVQPIADSMGELATYVSDVTVGLATLIAKVKELPGMDYYLKNIFPQVLKLNQITQALNLLRKLAPTTTPGMGGYPSSALGGTFIDPNEAARKAAEAAAAKRARELAALQKKTLDTQKKSLALQKASKTLNIEAIGIEAALKGKLNETDRLSLQLQKAILDGNATLATQLSDQLDTAIKRNNELRASLLATPKAPNPFSEWSIPKLDFGGNMLGTPVPNFVPPAYAMPPTFGQQGGLPAGVVAGVNPAPPINIKVEVAGEAVAAVITQTQTNQSLSGSFVGTNRTARFGTRVDEG